MDPVKNILGNTKKKTPYIYTLDDVPDNIFDKGIEESYSWVRNKNCQQHLINIKANRSR